MACPRCAWRPMWTVLAATIARLYGGGRGDGPVTQAPVWAILTRETSRCAASSVGHRVHASEVPPPLA
eukprot:1281483-Prymnesium_polylepis.1